jgi:hypothetical protein
MQASLHPADPDRAESRQASLGQKGQVAFMDPLRDTPLEEMRHVIRVAARLHGEDQARAERERLRQDMLRAAAEVGLTEEHLRKAAALVRRERRARRSARRWAITAACVCATWGTCGLWAVRQPVPAPPTAIYVEGTPDAGWILTEPAPAPPSTAGADHSTCAPADLSPAAVIDGSNIEPLSTAPPVPDAERLLKLKEAEVDRTVRGAWINSADGTSDEAVSPAEGASGTGP